MKEQKTKLKLVEVVAAFSFKKNTGNYENLDYFCSAKEECEKGKESETYQRLFRFCQDQVKAQAFPSAIPKSSKMSKGERKEKVGLSGHDADTAEGITDFGDAPNI